MFLPPDLHRLPAAGEDTIVLKYEGSGRTLTLEMGEYAQDGSALPRLEGEPRDQLASSELVDVAGRKVWLHRYPIGERSDVRRWAAHARVPDVPNRLSILAGPAHAQLYFGLDCESPVACDVAPRILATMEPLTQVLSR
jgi:hypothetical protein